VRILTPFAQNKPQQCVDVTLTADNLDVTLATATDGATIYYTTDGSFPWSGNSEAEIYAGEFSVDSGTTVRAAAYKSGLDGSNVLTRIVEGIAGERYFRPGGTETYRRPGGVEEYTRPL
jgi:hypothetical protein